MRQCEEYAELCEIPVSQSRAFANIPISLSLSHLISEGELARDDVLLWISNRL